MMMKSKKRKNYILVMNYYINQYENSGNDRVDVPKELEKIVNELIGLGYFDKESFSYLDKHNCKGGLGFLVKKYPLTPEGKFFLDKDWYKRLTESSKYQFVRDLFAFLGIILGIILSCLKIFQ